MWFASTLFLAAVPFSHFHVPLQVFSATPKYTTCTKFLDSGPFLWGPKPRQGLPWWLSGKESTCHCRRRGFDPWVGKIPWGRKWQPTPVVLPGKSHGQRSLTGYRPVQFSSVAQSCPTLCDPMNRSTPGLPVHHKLSEFTQTHVHRVDDAIQPSHLLSSPSPPAPNPSQQSGSFPMSQLFT